jgi:hypothetical protein
MPSNVPITEPTETGSQSRFQSRSFGSLIRVSRLAWPQSGVLTWRKSSLTANTPIITRMKLMPPNSSGKPNV